MAEGQSLAEQASVTSAVIGDKGVSSAKPCAVSSNETGNKNQSFTHSVESRSQQCLDAARRFNAKPVALTKKKQDD